MSEYLSVLFPNQKVECKIYSAYGNDFDQAQTYLFEAQTYEYELSPNYSLKKLSAVIKPSRTTPHCGLIETGVFVGLLKLTLLDDFGVEVEEVYLDVHSKKMDYLDEYQTMLGDITEYCTDLLVQLDSPVEQRYKADDCDDEATLVQRLYFLKSLVGTEEFKDSIQRIISKPNTRWMEELRERPLSSCSRMGRFEMRQVATSRRRQALPSQHHLSHLGSVPEILSVRDKRDSVDTQENRFIKHALGVFLLTIEDVLARLKSLQKKNKSPRYPGLTKETEELLSFFDEILEEGFFKEVERAQVLVLSSSVLQNKEGYRQILRAWLQFDLAARLSWAGGEDVYGDDYCGGKRDVATLYEYWGFFKLLDIVRSEFDLGQLPLEKFLGESMAGLSVKLKQGKELQVDGVYEKLKRKLNVRFSFNRTFSRAKEYPHGGSWTKQMRPDYTLSIWPQGLKESKKDRGEDEAERLELISHIHFDAKYKVDHFKQSFGQEQESEEELDKELKEEKNEQRGGTYKRADLLKMHAYRDAIRRTAGAYIIYPGSTPAELKGFHELLPGLGAFPLRPSGDDGSLAIKQFLKEVMIHISDRSSQYEQRSFHTYEVHRDEPKDKQESKDELHDEVLEYFCKDDEKIKVDRVQALNEKSNNILLGYIRDKDRLEWIEKTGLYNLRDNHCYSTEMAWPSHLLLWNKAMDKLLFFKTNGSSTRYDKKAMLEVAYPSPSNTYDYFVYKLGKPLDLIFPKEPLLKSFSQFAQEKNDYSPRSLTLESLLSGEFKG